jgi:hypothetical protein
MVVQTMRLGRIRRGGVRPRTPRSQTASSDRAPDSPRTCARG